MMCPSMPERLVMLSRPKESLFALSCVWLAQLNRLWR